MWRWHQIRQFLSYLLWAKTPAQIHSPFLFDLLQSIHDEARQYDVFEELEAMRTLCYTDDQAISPIDRGAGSQRSRPGVQRQVKDIARTALSSVPRCRLVYRLLENHRPQTILELGTSLGIMTGYLSSADLSAHIHTIEANPEISAIARSVGERLKLKQTVFHTGTFDDILPDLLPEIGPIDFLLIDGDHRGTALMRYYQMIKPVLAQNALVLIDDIRWSRDMYVAWQQLKQDDDIRCTLDYFSFGLCFFRKEFVEPVRLQVIPRRWPPKLL